MVAAVVFSARGRRAGRLRVGGRRVAAQTRRGPAIRHATLALPYLPRPI